VLSFNKKKNDWGWKVFELDVWYFKKVKSYKTIEMI
jgi:hypothetical protein